MLHRPLCYPSKADPKSSEGLVRLGVTGSWAVRLVHAVPEGSGAGQVGDALELVAVRCVVAVLREQRLNAARLLLARQGRPGSVAGTGAAAAAREDQPGGPDCGGHAPHLLRCGTPQSTAGSRMSAPTVSYSPPSSAPSTAITPSRLMAITPTSRPPQVAQRRACRLARMGAVTGQGTVVHRR